MRNSHLPDMACIRVLASLRAPGIDDGRVFCVRWCKEMSRFQVGIETPTSQQTLPKPGCCLCLSIPCETAAFLGKKTISPGEGWSAVEQEAWEVFWSKGGFLEKVVFSVPLT